MQTRTAQVMIAFATVYLVWGSTYLAIRVGVQSLPPVLFAGVRFLIAGSLMLAYALWRGAKLPHSATDWRNIAVTGFLMLVGGNGLVTWGEQWIESNQAALIVATSALWLAGMGSLGSRGDKLDALTLAGLLLGFGGVAVLVSRGLTAELAPWYAYAAISTAPVLWAAGTIWSRRNPMGCSAVMTASLQMLFAGLFQTGLGFTLGEGPRWNWDPDALAALVYLILFGSCAAYGAYFWLLHQVSPARLGTYAYVNPAVAVVLGWWLLGERLDEAQILGTLIILAGVVTVTLASRRAAH